jgi:Holliday junction resolvase RusA-like endonuclease
MEINIKTENCDFDNHFFIKESADSVIHIELKIPVIISFQSRRPLVTSLINEIQTELGKFKWIITGRVTVDFLWYLNAIERQETTKVGDLDNIAKPLQDALIGPNGLLIDDSQICGLYSWWQTRNHTLDYNILKITIKFNNDYTLLKSNLRFIQYYKAICMPVNFDSDINELFGIKALINTRLKSRRTADKIKAKGANVDRFLVYSEFDYHRTRLNAFSSQQILTLAEFNTHCKAAGLNFREILHIFRSVL